MARPNNMPETSAIGKRQPGGGNIFRKTALNCIINILSI
jgi:hypothetical protein